MADYQVGNIVYQVQMDVQQLLTAQGKLDERLAEMEDSFNENAEAAENLGSGLSKLAELIKLVVAASALRELASMVQKYQEMAERVQMATSSQIEYENVQKRLLTTANGTYRALEEAQELYIRTADSLRSMNYTTEQAMDIQDSMSYAFVKNATAADRAEAAIGAFSKSVNTGKVAADQWETLTSAIPSVINDIAAASGQSAAQIRALGASGKLTAKELTEGLRQSLDSNSEAAASMSNNLIDAGVRIKTAVTQIAVAFENQTGALQTFTNGLISAADGMLSFSQDSEKMSTAVQTGVTAATVFATLMAGRFVGSLAQSTSAKLSGIIASRQLASAELQSAKTAEYAATAVVRRSVANKEAAISALNLAQAEYNVARGSAAEAIALDNLTAKKSIAIAVSADLVVAENALAAATTRSAAAARTASAAWTLAKGALALIGGPVGVAFLAGAALLYFYQRAEEAKKAAVELADGVNGLIGKMQQMSRTQLLAEAGKLRASFTLLDQTVGESRQAFNVAEAAVKRLEKQLSALSEDSDAYKKKSLELRDAYDQQNIAADELTQATNRLGQAKSGVRILTAQANGEFREGIDLLRRDGQEAGVVTNLMNQLGKAFSFAAGQKEKFNATSLITERPQNIQDYLDKQLEQVELQGELNERKRAQLKAEQDIRRLVGKDSLDVKGQEQLERDVLLARQRAGAEFDNVKAQQDLTKSTKEGVSEGKKSESQAESIAQKLANLKQQSELAADSTKELTREQTILRAEQSLGNGATQEQIYLAGKYAAATFDVAASLKARQEAEQGRKFATQEIAASNVQVNPETGLAVDPLAEINLREQQKLDALAKYQALDLEGAQTYENAKTAIQQQAAMERKRIAIDENNEQMQNIGSIMGAASESFGSISEALAKSASESSAEYKAMFAVSKGFALAQAGLNLGLAISNALASGPFPWNLGAMAAVAAAGASLVSQVSSASYGGGRKNGGPVSAGSMYQVGESGLPEIYQASTGKQYMIPGDNGKVISNKEMQGSGGGGGVVINIQNYTSATVDAQASQSGGGITVDVIVADLDNGGPISQGISRNHQAPRKATQ